MSQECTLECRKIQKGNQDFVSHSQLSIMKAETAFLAQGESFLISGFSYQANTT